MSENVWHGCCAAKQNQTKATTKGVCEVRGKEQVRAPKTGWSYMHFNFHSAPYVNYEARRALNQCSLLIGSM